LIPATSGIFVVTLSLPSQTPSGQTITTAPPLSAPAAETAGGIRALALVDAETCVDGGDSSNGKVRRIQEHVIWDRKIDGGFPETKELKRRVRDLVEPGRGLGHVDRDYARKEKEPGMSVGAEGEEGIGRSQELQGEQVAREARDKEMRGENCQDCV
jgi:Rdx family